MKDSALQKHLHAKPIPTADQESGADEALDDLGTFGYLRGIHDRALMLEFRHKNGNIDAFPYAWLSRATFDPSQGISLRFGAETVTITGRNLNAEARPTVRLFAGILRHRVSWIQEADEVAALKSENRDIIVEGITSG